MYFMLKRNWNWKYPNKTLPHEFAYFYLARIGLLHRVGSTNHNPTFFLESFSTFATSAVSIVSSSWLTTSSSWLTASSWLIASSWLLAAEQTNHLNPLTLSVLTVSAFIIHLTIPITASHKSCSCLPSPDILYYLVHPSSSVRLFSSPLRSPHYSSDRKPQLFHASHPLNILC